MKKIWYILVFNIILLIGFLGITYSLEYQGEDSITFELIGPATLYIDINGEYEEYGVKVTKNGEDISDRVLIDSSMVDTYVLGEYKVKYEIDNGGNKEYIYRKVIVIDKETPVIKLKGEEVVYLILNGSYYEDGYEVIDNIDTDLSSKVKIIGNVDTSKVGEYKLEYVVVDSDGNVGSAYRTIIVMEPKITLADVASNKIINNANDVTKYLNTVTINNWTNNGIYIEGYVSLDSDKYQIMLKNKDNALEYVFEMDKSKKNYYKGNINLSLIPNGEYDLYVIGDKEERLINKLSGLNRLLRSKVGKRLVTFTYNDDLVGIEISDFEYEYDIVIDPGHGSRDIGASNGIKYEKDINLEQSMYEKCRYESMGFKVFLTRYDDSYGTMMGTDKLDQLQRRALTMGYYGVVSKVTYSNHHNASLYSGNYGFEMIVPNNVTKKEMEVEVNLYNKFKEYYGIRDNAIRLYSRDYDSEIIYDKLGGSVYNYMDYYAVIRIPWQLFNVKTTIFEPIYMSNPNDFSWYYTNKKWIDVTEIKIEEYVNYLGGTYISDNSMCL